MSYFFNLLMFLEKNWNKSSPETTSTRAESKAMQTLPSHHVYFKQFISECTGADDTMCFEYSFRQGVYEDAPIFSWY